MDTNAVQLIESFGNRLDTYVQAIAAKAGVATDHFYPVFVNQQRIEGIAFIAIYLVAGVLAYFMLRMAVNNTSPANMAGGGQQYTAVAKCVVGYTLGAVLALSFIMGSGNGGASAVGKTFNPEYYAVQSLVQMVK